MYWSWLFFFYKKVRMWGRNCFCFLFMIVKFVFFLIVFYFLVYKINECRKFIEIRYLMGILDF